jgi:SAM-dependent methyltransferase
MTGAPAADPYAVQGHDRVRETFELDFFARLLPRLLHGPSMLDLGCGDGQAATLAGPGLRRYTGVDLAPPAAEGFVAHDLRQGLGPVGDRPYGLYLGTFGLASHLRPGELRRLLFEIARHARPGAVVALEALGLGSLEWPGIWDSRPGAARELPYRLAADVPVHPWAPGELAALYEEAGIRALTALDRSVQTGPKLGTHRYWPGLPSLRGALNSLLADEPPEAARAALAAPLPPLPAGRAALVHHALAARRRRVAERLPAAELARAIWALEPAIGGGYGHGLSVVGRVR